jgi:carbonic anhydrase
MRERVTGGREVRRAAGALRARRAAGILARAGGLVTVSMLVGGCSLPPSGERAARASRGAVRPEFHETRPNPEPDCIALVTQDPAPARRASEASPGCSACACRDAGGPLTLRNPPSPERDGEPGPAAPAGAEDELQRLMDGNKRFVEGEAENLVRGPQPPAAEGAERRPVAMVLACSDLEVPPEAAFDAAAGELFVVRVPGHVADAAAVAGARFAVEQFDIALIVVLGHADCGALHRPLADEDAVEGRPAGLTVPRGEALARPAHDAEGRAEGSPADAAVEAHVDEVVDHLRRDADPALSRLVDDGKLTIVGALYDGTNGLVTLQPDPAEPLAAVADTSGE